jgi:thymidylate kinase
MSKLMTSLVSLESCDGQGKTTHAKRLVEHLNNAGFDAVYVKSPDIDSLFYERIYDMLKSGAAIKYPISFQLLQFVNKLHFQLRKLPKLKRTMDVIVLDRWDVSMQAYGKATGVPFCLIRMMSAMLTKPDQVFLLRGNRTIRESPRDSYENDDSLQTAVSEYYNSKTWRSNYAEVTEIVVAENRDDTFKAILKSLKL